MSSNPGTPSAVKKPVRGKSVEPKEKRPVQEIREEIRSYIRNERDTILKKWLALKESIRSEDSRRNQFLDRKLKEDTKSLPMHVLKFIGTLKKSVRNTMRYKGGTPYSIIRSLFLYWDADKSGKIDKEELMCCMKSLGVKVTEQDCAGIVSYYSGGSGDSEMDYRELLQDVLTGEPSVIAFVSQEEDEERDQKEIRFEEVADKWVSMPLIVVKFIEAVRLYLTRTMQRDGGTPHQHIRYLFTFYDYDYSNGLDPKELMTACYRRMNMTCTYEQAKEIVEYYDRKNRGEISPDKFIEDVCQDVKPILSYTEITTEERTAHLKSLAANPFIPKPFHAPPNKVLEKFKQDCKLALVNKVNKSGGTVASWIRDAFVYWDPYYTRKIRNWEALQGAALRIGVHINEEDAKTLMKCYDRFNTGEMHYQFLSDEIMKEDAHFLMDAKLADPDFNVIAKQPPMVSSTIDKIKNAVEKFVTRSKGALSAKDILNGTFLKYDAEKNGFVSNDGFKYVIKDIKARQISDNDIIATAKWFDTNGSQKLDYNELIRQMYGGDILTDKLILPKIKESTSLKYKESFLGSSGIAMLKARSQLLTPSGVRPPIKPNKNLDITKCSGFSTLADKSVFTVKPNVMEKNMEIVESQAVKNARAKIRRNKILQDKVKIERRLQSIEEQKQKIIEDYKARRGK